MYQVKNTSRSEFVPIRNQTYHVRVWGHAQEGVAPLVLVHGWMDVAASFQFVVDAMQTDRHIVAPDWRGYGQTEWRMPPGTTEAPPDAGAKGGTEPALQGPRPPGRTDNYWFADYLADLDFLIDHYSPKAAVDLLGSKKSPTDADIDAIENVCRCGTYGRIRAAIKLAAQRMA